MYSTQALSYHHRIYQPASLFLPSSYKDHWISYQLLTGELMTARGKRNRNEPSRGMKEKRCFGGVFQNEESASGSEDKVLA
jgi:hypothetical protein